MNRRYFDGHLLPIDIRWSSRLTSSVGMFVSEVGPRARSLTGRDRRPERRHIRLSLPLFQQLAARTSYAEQELLSTLAHEMIHQWQFDLLKRRPNHGPDFLGKMREMNRSGLLGITVRHSLKNEVQSLSRYAWQCQKCGRVYRRQRRSIQPRRHQCGACRGFLRELESVILFPATPAVRRRSRRSPSSQLTLPFRRTIERSLGSSPQR